MFVNRLLLLVVATMVVADGVSGRRGYGRSRMGGRRGSCPAVSLANGVVTPRSGNRMMSFRCSPGFRIFGSITITCVRGKWNKAPPVCVAPGCPDVTTSLPPNLEVKRLRLSGTVIQFECTGNTTMAGSDTIFCARDEWSDRVPVCYDVPTTDSTYHKCDFESGLCGWTDTVDDVFNWTRHYRTDTSNTGPSHDHSLGDGDQGHFMFIESSTPRQYNDTARLLSPIFSPSWSGSCFNFWYHMYAGVTNKNNMGTLNVYAQTVSTRSATPSFAQQGNYGDKWHVSQIKIPTFTESFQIVFEAIRGVSFYSDIAIDDVTLWRCPHEGATTLPATTESSTLETTTETERTTSMAAAATTEKSTTPSSTTPSTTTTIMTTTVKQTTELATEKDSVVIININKGVSKPGENEVVKPAAAGGVIGRTGASTEEERSDKLVPIAAGVSGGVGVVVVVIVAVFLIRRRNKLGSSRVTKSRPSSGYERTPVDSTYVTPSNGQPNSVNVTNSMYMSLS